MYFFIYYYQLLIEAYFCQKFIEAYLCHSGKIMVQFTQNKKPPNMYLVETEGVEPSSRNIGT